ncbi:hypothetical protein OsJ_10820 [Oryza sativa Japonica Group]|uniref:Uncharacterized protein n=1 Tax=Oryza sativa subsp. japonica TaxID=39947 RepID=B9F8F1_ORYSJ|nr:hypothetical protein OsJ_10820 [Oryza sativa Japonica Group]
MPDKTVCEKHYVQAKKRAASSGVRASLRRSSASASAARGTTPPARMAVARPILRQGRGGAGELVGRGSAGLVACSSAAGAAAAATCHQCRRVANTICCTSCDRRGYCTNCISRWYSDIPIDDVRKVCPACRGICNCRVCLLGDNVIKARVQEISAVDKLEYLHSILASVLPVLKQIYSDQCFEIGVDTKAYGLRTDIIRAKVNPDEQMCCDFCKVPVFDYHRHCPRCLYDLCLDCCRDIRRSRTSVARGEYAEGRVVDRSKDTSNKRARMEPSAESANDKSVPQRRDIKNIDIRSLFPTWRVNNDGSITCGPHEAGGCGSSKLVLRRIFKINWISKLVKNSEEMVNGCKVHVLENGCSSCNDGRTLELTGHRNFGVSTCSNNGGIDRFCVFSPVLEDLKSEGIIHFRKHWIKGEPVVIRNAFEPSLSSSWDPLNIWRGIQEIMDEEVDDDVIVKAVDCSNQAEVDIELKQFIKGYSDGHKGEDGELMMLKLKEWPPPSVLEEFLLCQRPEFIVNFPLVDFIHSRWGLLNLSAKLPPDTLQPEVGLKLLIAYGRHQEAGKGDSVTNLMINMADVVHMLMHTAKGHDVCPKRLQPERSEKIANGMTMHVNAHAPVQNLNVDMGNNHLTMQDISKLNEYLTANWEELAASSQVKNPIYEQSIYLNKYHKRILKDQYGIEPWTFQQHIGEAVFVPAGCPFQVKNLQSTVQLALDFLSPESLGESARMAQEIRCLPNDHDAKLKMLEIGKISLYAASSAVREIQRITLDPKFNLDLKFEDQNLTQAVSENLARVTKQRNVPCS